MSRLKALYKDSVATQLREELELANVNEVPKITKITLNMGCLLYTSPSPRDQRGSRMPSSA